MKRFTFRPALAAALICCIVSVVFLAGCGKDTDPAVGSGRQDSDTIIDSTSALLPDGTGVNQQHIVLAGFGMGSDTPESFSAKFGEPLSAETKEYSVEKITTENYEFGVFEFDGPLSGPQVLSYVGVNGELSGPCMVMPGDDLYLTADAIYTGSAQKIREGRETGSSVSLYGEENGVQSGQFIILDVEFITSDTPEVSCLQYNVPFSNGGKVRYMIYFDSNDKVTRYDIFYETQQ